MAILYSVLAAALLVVAMLQPFLPGRYDPLAEPLAALAAVCVFGGLLLAPIGALWLIRPGPGVARTALVVATAVVAVASIIAAAAGSISAGAIACVAWLACLGPLWRRAGALDAHAWRRRALPSALIAVPLVAVAARVAMVPIVAAVARDRAIANAAGILDDIERFRQRTGGYPIAIQSLVPDYHPDVVGIERYRYEPSGESFNLYFEMPSTDLATSLIVMYNPRGEQDFSSHAVDLLQLSPEEVRRRRGYFASERLPQPGWTMFLFD
jgi:hypothetical protein